MIIREQIDESYRKSLAHNPHATNSADPGEKKPSRAALAIAIVKAHVKEIRKLKLEAGIKQKQLIPVTITLSSIQAAIWDLEPDVVRYIEGLAYVTITVVREQEE